MDHAPTILLRWCKQREGIRIKREFLQIWNNQRPSPITDMEAAYTELKSNFLSKDLSECAEPVIPEEYGQEAYETFPPSQLRQGGGVVLQIQHTMDLSNSTFSLLNCIENGDNFPRGLLQWILTDGTRHIHAMEIETIPGLDLKTPFGCKLLVQNCKLKRGMLLFTKHNIKVLGGSVPALYGGNMLKELEIRFRAILGLSNEPVTPTPNRADPSTARGPTHTANESSTSQSTYDRTNNMSYGTATTAPPSTRTVHMIDNSNQSLHPQLVDELNELNEMDLNQFDDMDMEMTESNGENIPFIPSDDDDFVMTQAPPIPRTSTSTPRKKTTKTSEASPPRAVKRKKVTDTVDSMEIDEEAPKVKKEKAPVVQEEVHWLSFSDEDEDEGVEVDERGRAHIAFDKLSEVLTAMDNNSYTGKIADVVVVKAKFLRLAKIKYSTLSGFYVIFDIASPTEEEGSVVKVVVSHKLFAQLLNLSDEVLADMPNLMKSKSTIKKMIVPFESNMKLKLAELEIDLSLTEKALTEKGQDVGQIVAPCKSYTIIN
ncbi:unnamed protein product [Mucor hiemalis]